MKGVPKDDNLNGNGIAWQKNAGAQKCDSRFFIRHFFAHRPAVSVQGRASTAYSLHNGHFHVLDSVAQLRMTDDKVYRGRLVL